jgi:hypothetical protein
MLLLLGTNEHLRPTRLERRFRSISSRDRRGHLVPTVRLSPLESSRTVIHPVRFLTFVFFFLRAVGMGRVGVGTREDSESDAIDLSCECDSISMGLGVFV